MDPNAGKAQLRNKIGRQERERQLAEEDFKRITVSFYRYVMLREPYALRDTLFSEWSSLNCFGRVYLAEEGINAQMSVPEHHWEQFQRQVHAHAPFAEIPFKVAVEDDGKSFYKLTVKVRTKILTDGLEDDSYDVTNVGQHLDAEQWNQAMESGATVVDIRNHYESEVGHFENALLPASETFREELPEVLEMLRGKEEEKILLYCTGGIRCEKTSAYLRHHGFKDVNQLHGGIIDYAQQIKTRALPNRFKGKNFVFDKRLGERISEEVISHCHQCGTPCDSHVNCANVDCNLLFIQCAQCAQQFERTCSKACQAILQEPEASRKRLKGEGGPKIFRSHRKVEGL